MSGTTYRVVLHREALAEIAALRKKLRVEMKQIIDGLAHDPRPPGAERLKGRKNAFRIRAGEYRLLYEVHVTEIVVYVIGVAHRREVYLRLLRRR
jgi:mRNA interferase RelE/StbE